MREIQKRVSNKDLHICASHVEESRDVLNRAVESERNTLEILLSPTPDADATKRLFVKTLQSTACSAPQAHLLAAQGGQSTASP